MLQHVCLRFLVCLFFTLCPNLPQSQAAQWLAPPAAQHQALGWLCSAASGTARRENRCACFIMCFLFSPVSFFKKKHMQHKKSCECYSMCPLCFLANLFSPCAQPPPEPMAAEPAQASSSAKRRPCWAWRRAAPEGVIAAAVAGSSGQASKVLQWVSLSCESAPVGKPLQLKAGRTLWQQVK